MDTVFLDKTGTVTAGRPEVTDIVPADGIPADRVLALAARAESGSRHPAAQAVMRRAEGMDIPPCTGFRAVPGEGVVCTAEGIETAVGNMRLMTSLGVDISPVERAYHGLLAEEKTCMIVSYGGTAVGAIAVSDPVRDG